MKIVRSFAQNMLAITALVFFCQTSYAQSNSFKWPEGKKFALSLSFDDARESQVIAGTALLDAYNVKATFFVVPSAVEKQLAGWKKAVASGHEIGNHSLTHPCAGNFAWSRLNALEDYSLKKMRENLVACNKSIEVLLQVRAEVFAYPCGQKYVGSGTHTHSYVPLVADMFLLGRGWRDEPPNDTAFDNFAQITGIEMDGKTLEDLLPLLKDAAAKGLWVVLAAHEMGEEGSQTTRLSMLKQVK